MTSKYPHFAIALYKTKIEFFQQKIEPSWSVVDRIDLTSVEDAQLGDIFAEYAERWKTSSEAITLWLPENICRQYEFDEAQAAEAVYAEYMREKRISNLEIVVFANEAAKAPKFHYLAVERQAFESAVEFVTKLGFVIEGYAISPASSTFPVLQIFDADTRENAGYSDAPEESVELVADASVNDEAAENADGELAETAMVSEANDAEAEAVEEPLDDDAPVDASPTQNEADEAPDAPTKPRPSWTRHALAASLIFVAGLGVFQATYSYWGPMVPTPWANMAVASSDEGALAPDAAAVADTAEADAMDAELNEDIPEFPDEMIDAVAAADAAGEVAVPPARDVEKIAAIEARIEAQTQISDGSTGAGSSDGSVDLDGLMLIGIYGPQGKPQAMIRSPKGGIHTVKLGATVDGWNVVAISRNEVIVSKDDNQLRLTVPN